ncbi:hypothetical protein [Ruminococcus callidus]|uniref:hypothetical protein n=1 Tax=Ruminococcus callidus TaxID=40519 RepID=UPI0035226560
MASTIAKKITTIVYNPTGFREIPCHFPFSAFFDFTFANTALPAGFTRYCPKDLSLLQFINIKKWKPACKSGKFMVQLF